MKPKRVLLVVVLISVAAPILLFLFYDSPPEQPIRARKLLIKKPDELLQQNIKKPDELLQQNIQSQNLLNQFQSSNPYTPEENMKNIQRKRLIQLSKGCNKLKQKGLVPLEVEPKSLKHIVVNDEHKVLYCYIPKVACTNMKRIFLLMTGKMNTTNPLDLKSNDVHFKHDDLLTYLNEFSPDEIQEKIQNYKKIIFLRDPYERLLSAYRNKFADPKSLYFHKRFGRRIIRKTRKSPTIEELEKGNDVKFVEFVQYLTDPVTIQEGYNEHWALYNTLCHPCTLKYNFIGKYETLDSDVDQVLSHLQMKDTIKFPPRNATYKRKKTGDMLADYYNKIPSEDLKKLWKIYSVDYKVFDYQYPEFLNNLL